MIGVHNSSPEAQAVPSPAVQAAGISATQAPIPVTPKSAPTQASGRASMFPEVEPFPEPVDGARLLDDIVATIKRYLIAEDATFRAATLWAVHTWLMDVWTVSPIANITAPEMRCGKTLLLQALEELVYRPMQTSNSSSAALFRIVDELAPTLLIDEVDSFLKGNDDARGILNSGLYRKSAYVSRCVGDHYTPKQFSVWAAKALCGIGELAATLADRSICLRLRRKLPDEYTENLRRSHPEQWSTLRARILRWVNDHRDDLKKVQPKTIAGLNDRANDCWEPLLAIAEVAGGGWIEHSRSAAIALQDVDDDAPSVGVMLLKDIRDVFRHAKPPRMFSSELLKKLTDDSSDMRWGRWNNGKPLTPHQLASHLRKYGIHAKPLRIAGRSGNNGYELSWFSDAFARYLPAEDLTVQHPDDAASSDQAGPPAAARVEPGSVTETDERLSVGVPTQGVPVEDEMKKYAHLFD